MLSSTAAFADGPDFSLNSVPALSAAVGEARYKAAADKAQEAFLIQSGIEQKFDQVKVVVTKSATETTTKAIDNNTPFKSKDVFFVAGTGYAIFVKKSITQKFKNPIFPTVMHTVTVGKGNGSLGLAIPF